MISKNKLQSIISKYYLGGKVESVKWKVENGQLNIDFMAPTKDMIGKLSCSDFLYG
jgi:anti-sigma28 factor (negative regulator of flagellin synthesis)